MNDLPGLVKQCHRDSERWFPSIANDLAHMVLGLCGESGEVAELVKKVQRGSMRMEDAVAEIAEEGVDALIYLCNVFAILGIDPVEVYKRKRAKNELRFGAGPLRDAIDNHPAAPNSGHYCLSDTCDHRSR